MGSFFVANIALSDAEYSPLGALWSLVFLAGPGLFLPFEQEISRALAERARHGRGAPVVRRAGTLGSASSWACWSCSSCRPAGSSTTSSTARSLLVGLALKAGALAGHLTRGSMSGTGRFKGYGTTRCGRLHPGHGGGRVPGGRSPSPAVRHRHRHRWPAGCARGAAGAEARAGGWPESPLSEVGSALVLLLVASLCAFAIMNIGPVLVKLLADDSQSAPRALRQRRRDRRIPLFLFQAVQASLLPKLSGLASSGQLGDFRRGCAGCWWPWPGSRWWAPSSGPSSGRSWSTPCSPAPTSAPAPWASWPPGPGSTCWPWRAPRP